MARPKPTGDETLKTISIQFREGTLKKMDYITWYDRRNSRRAVLEDAMQDLITKWEKKNGAITDKELAAMAKALGE